jgi:phosphoglycolate phosphatase
VGDGARAVARDASLHAAGHRCFVATLKPSAPTQRILSRTGLGAYVVEAVSPDNVAPPYADKAASVAALMARYKIRAVTACLVGDAPSDWAAALANGLSFFAATYGYGGLSAADPSYRALAALPDLLAAWPELEG